MNTLTQPRTALEAAEVIRGMQIGKSCIHYQVRYEDELTENLLVTEVILRTGYQRLISVVVTEQEWSTTEDLVDLVESKLSLEKALKYG